MKNAIIFIALILVSACSTKYININNCPMVYEDVILTVGDLKLDRDKYKKAYEMCKE